MQWRKLGRILVLEAQGGRTSHAAVPILGPPGQDPRRLYFTSRDTRGRSHVWRAELRLGGECPAVVRVEDEPVLAPGSAGQFDDHGAMATCLVERDGVELLYYVGWNLGVCVPFRNALGLAISEDGGRTFRKLGTGPLLDRSPHDPCFVATGAVLAEDDRWRMWYASGVEWQQWCGGLRPRYLIKYAESTDGIHWRREGRLCLDPRDNGEHAFSQAFVLREHGRYRMWYSWRGTTYRIGYAESVDGLRWTRMDELVGIETSVSGWDSEMIEYPFLFDHDGRRYLLYNGNGFGRTGIGLAVLEQDDAKSPRARNGGRRA